MHGDRHGRTLVRGIQLDVLNGADADEVFFQFGLEKGDDHAVLGSAEGAEEICDHNLCDGHYGNASTQRKGEVAMKGWFSFLKSHKTAFHERYCLLAQKPPRRR